MRPGSVHQAGPLPTAADYFVRAICPALIMALVGSLALFIQEITYAGAHELRLRWLVFWCAIAMVGVSRIAIERTPVYAGIYALILGVVTYGFVSEFFQMPLIGWFMLALIWWCTNKLVYDCTLINEEEDASGEGLLGLAGMDETRPDAEVAIGKKRPAPKLPAFWKPFFTNARAPSNQPHAPGLWVLYFSFAALPIFGVGQLLAQRMGDGKTGMLYVVVYLTSAAALLLLTSFLGLRRYLRQRRLIMPSTMAVRWIATGAGVVVLVLLISLVLPRPVPLPGASTQTSLLQGETREDENYTEGGRQSEEEPGGESDDEATEDETEATPGDTPQTGEESEDPSTATSSSSAQNPIPNPLNSPMVRWLMWGVFALAVLVFGWKNRRALINAIHDLIDSLMNLFRRESRKPKPIRKGGGAESSVSGLPTRRFIDLPNPFANQREPVPPDVAVTQTFDALEVWAAEAGCPRGGQMTANEFACELTYRHPEIKREINRLVALHAGQQYGDRLPHADELPPLMALWSYMESNRRPAMEA